MPPASAPERGPGSCWACESGDVASMASINVVQNPSCVTRISNASIAQSLIPAVAYSDQTPIVCVYQGGHSSPCVTIVVSLSERGRPAQHERSGSRTQLQP